MRNNGISADELAEYVDVVAEELDESQRLNFLRWPILSEYVHQNPVALGSYSKEVERVKEYLQMRVGWMDRKLGYTWQPIEQPSAVGNPQSDISSQQSARKIMRDGQLLIEREGKTYTVTGERVE